MALIEEAPTAAQMRKNGFGVFTVTELCKLVGAQPPYKPKYCIFRRDNLTIEIPLYYDEENKEYLFTGYYIDLERCNNAEQLMDWILDLLGKRVMCADLLWDVLCTIDLACEEIFGDAIYMVYYEGMKNIDWKNGTHTVIKNKETTDR
jgi:hypothetical protein